jgi:RimJ/RimL family protein N-acetyltransferase
MNVLRTPRLLLIGGTAETLTAELVSRQALGELLAADVPESWPPELYDAGAIRWMLSWLEAHPHQATWSLYYVAERPRSHQGRPLLVGIAGYKGAPDASGVVEIGYGIVPEQWRRGFASEAVRCLLGRAFDESYVAAVIAHTLPELAPSIGVLRRTGFLFDGPGNDPEEPTAIRFVLTRARYEELTAATSTALVDPPRPESPSVT